MPRAEPDRTPFLRSILGLGDCSSADDGLSKVLYRPWRLQLGIRRANEGTYRPWRLQLGIRRGNEGTYRPWLLRLGGQRAIEGT